jgi:hypothetical protein
MRQGTVDDAQPVAVRRAPLDRSQRQLEQRIAQLDRRREVGVVRRPPRPQPRRGRCCTAVWAYR